MGGTPTLTLLTYGLGFLNLPPNTHGQERPVKIRQVIKMYCRIILRPLQSLKMSVVTRTHVDIRLKFDTKQNPTRPPFPLLV